MMRLLTPALSSLAILVFATGCPPERPDQVAPAGTDQLAVLASGIDGSGTDIVILDGTGREVDRIETDLSWAQGIGHTPDGNFLVGSDGYLFEVNRDGSTTRFTDQPMWGGIYGVTVNEEGEVTVGNAEDGVTKFDDEGEVIVRAVMGGTCFMDTSAIPGDSGGDAAIDIYGPQIVRVDSETGVIEPLAVGVGWDTGHVAVDNSGRFYAADWYGTQIYGVAEGTSAPLVDLRTDFPEADYVVAMATAGNRSVFSLVDGSMGSSLLEIDSQGNVTEVSSADGEIWYDLVLF